MSFTKGAAGKGLMFTVRRLLGPSHPLRVWVTHLLAVVGTFKSKTGAVALLGVEAAVVYQVKLIPFAIKEYMDAFWQVSMFRVTGAAGVTRIAMFIWDLGPSQPLRDWLTHLLVVSGMFKSKTGAVVLPGIPVAVVYHFKLLPKAVNV